MCHSLPLFIQWASRFSNFFFHDFLQGISLFFWRISCLKKFSNIRIIIVILKAISKYNKIFGFVRSIINILVLRWERCHLILLDEEDVVIDARYFWKGVVVEIWGRFELKLARLICICCVVTTQLSSLRWYCRWSPPKLPTVHVGYSYRALP